MQAPRPRPISIKSARRPYQAPQRSPHRGGGHSSPRHSLARARDRGRWAFGTGVFGSPGNPRRTQSWGGPQQVELERANTSFSREDPGAGDSAQRAVGVGGRPSMMRGSGEVAPARLLARAERPARVEPPAARRGLVGGARASLGRECCQLAGVSPIQYRGPDPRRAARSSGLASLQRSSERQPQPMHSVSPRFRRCSSAIRPSILDAHVAESRDQSRRVGA